MEQKTSKHLADYFEENFTQVSLPLLNGHVYYIFIRTEKCIWSKSHSPMSTIRKINESSLIFQVKKPTVAFHIKKLYDTMIRLKKDVKKMWNDIIIYLQSPFTHQPVLKVTDDGNIANHVEQKNNDNGDIENYIEQMNCEESENKNQDIFEKITDSDSTGVVVEAGRPNKMNIFSHSLRNVYIENQDCNYCSMRLNSLKAIRKRNRVLGAKIKEYKEEESYLRKKYREMKRKELRSRLSAHLWKTKLKKQKAFRSDEEIKLSKIVKSQKISISQMKRLNRNVIVEYDNLLKLKCDEIARLSMELEKYKDKNKELILENHNLICSALDKS